MSAESSRTVFRLPRSTYFVVLFLFLGVTVLVRHPVLAVCYVIPLATIIFVRRTATIIDVHGITVRALLGQKSLPWADVRGLGVSGRNVFAIVDGGQVRLPCVRIADLHAVSAASGDHLPELPEATPKYAPPARRRR